MLISVYLSLQNILRVYWVPSCCQDLCWGFIKSPGACGSQPFLLGILESHNRILRLELVFDFLFSIWVFSLLSKSEKLGGEKKIGF